SACHCSPSCLFFFSAIFLFPFLPSFPTRRSSDLFSRLDESTSWALSPGSGHYVVRDGSLIAWINPTTPAEAVPGFRVFGSHTDSPAFKLKPGAEYTAEGMRQVGVEIYGGPLLNSWLDRELAFAGRLSLADGTVALARTGPIARIPQLAIHLDRQVNDGLTLDKQRHTAPVIGLADLAEADVIELLAASAEVDPETVVGHDVYTVPTQEPSRFGAAEEFFASPRLDNLLSVHAGVSALANLDADGLEAIAL